MAYITVWYFLFPQIRGGLESDAAHEEKQILRERSNMYELLCKGNSEMGL